MKIKLFYACVMLSFAIASCSDSSQTKNATNDADTAVLVNDPANTMNADPVNDTIVVEHADH